MKEKFDYYDSGISSLMFVVLQYLFLQAYTLLPRDIKTSFVAIIASCLLECIFLLTVFLTSRITKTKMLKASTFDKKVNVKGILFSLVIAVVFLIFASPLTNVFASFLDKIGYVSGLGGIVVKDFGTYVLYILVMCIIPAVTEEALFRGCIVGGLKEKNKHMAVFVGAIFFMLMHGGPDQTVHQFIMGVLAGYIFVYTENIWYPIIIHFANNFMAVTISYIYSGIETAAETTTAIASWSQIGISLVYAVIMGAAGAALLYYLIKELIKSTKQETLENNVVITTVGEEKIQTVSGDLVKKDNRKSWPVIAFFVLSGLYLLFEWVATLLLGLGVV